MGTYKVESFPTAQSLPVSYIRLVCSVLAKNENKTSAQKEFLIALRRFVVNHINNYFASGMPTLKFNVSFICLGERKLFLNDRFYLREKKSRILLRTIKCQPRKLYPTRPQSFVFGSRAEKGTQET